MQSNILVFGDLHCGADSGILGPSRWQEQIKLQQSLVWGWYNEIINEHGPFDMAFEMGDAVDGEGKKEHINTIIPNTADQADAAQEVIEATGVPGDKIFMVRGSPYHVSGSYNYEDPIAKALGASIADEQFLNVHGLKIHLRHVTGRSDTAYGQGTPLYRDSIRDLVDSAINDEEAADLILRGHIHMSVRVDVGYRTAISAPCLQLPGSVFGRKCRAMYYHVGVGKLVVRSRTDWTYTPILMPLKLTGGRTYTQVN